MKLSPMEFQAMQSKWRQWALEHVEYAQFRRFGFQATGKKILEIGCGSGYAATLIARESPASYLGIDLMPEQIELAKARNIPGFRFEIGNAESLDFVENGSQDAVLIFGVLHHVTNWRQALREARRVLKPGGMLYVEEPTRSIVKMVDFFSRWGHEKEALFSGEELENGIKNGGFVIRRRINLAGMWSLFAAEAGNEGNLS